MKILLNSNMLPIISVAMYGTVLEPDFIFSSETIDQDFKEGYSTYDSEDFWNNFDNKAYVAEIQRLAALFIDGTYTEGDISVIVKAGEIYSPKEYNFTNDNIDLEVTYIKKDMLSYAKRNMEKFDEFLKEHYTSTSGFWSWTANNFTDWLIEYKLDKSQEVAAILRFWFENEINGKYKTFSDFENYFVPADNDLTYSDFYKQPEV